MNQQKRTSISIEVLIDAPSERVWECFTQSEHITGWNFASEDWHCPEAENNLIVGGAFSWRMEALDKSFGFDFKGTYSVVEIPTKIEYHIEDGRSVKIQFIEQGKQTRVVEVFEAENENPVQLQKQGWQAILNNFKKYSELYFSN